jgi:4-methylaminobutanoate oxidase (formaldehyde-forming)
MFGHTVGTALGMGYVSRGGAVVERDDVLGGSYEIEVAGERVPARVSLQPFYDPTSARVKG